MSISCRAQPGAVARHLEPLRVQHALPAAALSGERVGELQGGREAVRSEHLSAAARPQPLSVSQRAESQSEARRLRDEAVLSL